MGEETLRNKRLRTARLCLPSPSGSGRPMAREELADAMNAYLHQRYASRAVRVDARRIGDHERGRNYWPDEQVREAYRAVLGFATDAELGFYPGRDGTDDVDAAGHLGSGPLRPALAGTSPTDAGMPEYLDPDMFGESLHRHSASADGARRASVLGTVELASVPFAFGAGFLAVAGIGTDSGTAVDHRRAGGGLGLAGLSGPSVWEEIVAQQSMDFAARARRSVMDPAVLDDLEARLRRISHAYLHAPHPRAHFGELVAVRDYTFRQIESERPRPDQARQLHALAGVACALLAQSTHEMGLRQAAMSHAHAAFVCAEMSGFDSLQVWIRATQAAIAEYAGLPMETVRYAEAGRAHASRGTAVVRLMSLAANGHARMGDLNAARAALCEAQRARDAAVDDDPLDDFGGVFTVSLAKQHAYGASAMALLRQGPDATAAASRALELYQAVPAEQRQPVNEAYAHIDVALGRLLSGELEGVGDALAPVLTLPLHARVDLLDEKLRRVHRQLTQDVPGDRPAAVRDVQGRIEEFVATVTIPALP